jgi:MFS family permease
LASEPITSESLALDVRRAQRRTLGLLVTTQVLGGVGVAIGVAVGTLLAAQLAGTDTLAGLAATSAVVGTALVAVPVSRVTDRYGRRPGLALAYGTGALGAAVIVLAGVVGSFPLGLAGMVLFGGASAGNLQARYAATDLATSERRGTALSIVVWATTIGAVLGPNLADPAGELAGRFGLDSLAGPFLLSLVVFAASVAAILTLLRPDPLLLARAARGVDLTVGRARTSVRAALRIVAAHPGALLGLGAIALGHSVMVGVMTMTPVHMEHGGATLRVIGLVISVHIAGMYALSPLVGIASDRIGRRPVILAGCALLLAACATAGSADEHSSAQLGVGLTVLGLGWSCTLVAGSTLLTESVPVDARPSVQGASDVVMNLAGAAASVVAGLVVGLAGFAWLALLAAFAVLPLVGAALRPSVTR